VDTGAVHLLRLGALPFDTPLADALLNDHEDNLFFQGRGIANEPIFNPHATAYLLRDEAEAAIRVFYSLLASGFSHSVLEPVEHRWTHGQFFGPPSTDGAWFELYRNMLLRETDNETLTLGQATPRKWLEDGKTIDVQQAPTYYGTISFTMHSQAGSGKIATTLALPGSRKPGALLIRMRHPDRLPMRHVTVNGEAWRDFDPEREWVRIPSPSRQNYAVVASY
jgi:hypothetical protein